MDFATDRRRPAWTYTTRGVLWQLHTGSQDFLVGEDRKLDAREVSFFCLERDTGVVRWEGLVPGDRWWSGIEAVSGGVVLFHGFASPDMPLHRGLTAVDCASGRVLWNLASVRFLRMEGDTIVALREGWEGGVVERLQCGTGAVPGGAGHEGPAAGSARGQGPETRLPLPLAEAADENPGLLAAIRSAIPETARRESAVGVRWDDHCVLSYCEPCPGHGGEESGLRMSLVVLGGMEWSRLFSDVIQSRARVAAPEPFFCQERVLYYVKEHSTLVAVPLRMP